MEYSEAKQQIESLSKNYSADVDLDGEFDVFYQDSLIIYVRPYRYSLESSTSMGTSFPMFEKAYMIMAELSATPVEDRKDKIKYKVSVLNEYLNIDEHNKPLLADDFNTDSYQTIFTLAEISKIKERKDIPFDWDKVNIKPIYVS